MVPQYFSEAPDGSIKFGHYGPADHRKYGNVLAFTLVTESPVEPLGYVFKNRYLASCSGTWSTDSFLNARFFSKNGPLDNARKTPLHARDEIILPIDDFDGLEGIPDEFRPHVAKNLRTWCAKATGKRDDEVPLAMSSDRVVYMLLRTLVKRGAKAEAWFDFAGAKEDVVTVPTSSGRPKAVNRISADPTKESARIHFSADCASRTMAKLSEVVYHPDGNVKESRRDSAPRYRPQIPDSIGEGAMRLLCRF